MNAYLLKLALPTIVPPPSAVANAVKALPKPGKVPVISAAFKDAAQAFSPSFSGAAQAAGTVRPGSKFIKAASAAFFSELEEMIAAGVADPMLRDKFASADVEALVKEALNLQGIGQAAKGALGAAGKSVGGALQSARGAVANVAGKVSPTLNKPVLQAANDAAHSLQHSSNSFAQGVGNVLHHKAQTPGKAFLAAANPVGTAAEMLTAGAGNAASKGLAAAGGKLQAAAGAGQDAVTRAGRAMTPKGRLMNAAESFGGRVQKSFSPGGTGHNVATKALPLAGEIGGAVGAGLALHAPVGLAGVAGKMGLMGLGKAAPAIGAAIEHAPHAAEAIAQKVTPVAKGIGNVLHHGAEDVLGTLKQNATLGRLGKPAAQAVRHSMLPAAMA